MTKVSRINVKCIKCGEECEQVNDKLRIYLQKCPNCGYEAMDISLELKEYKNEENLQTICETSNEIENQNDEIKDSFENVVQDRIKDPFFSQLVIDHFKKERNSSDYVSISCFANLSKYDDILNEFTKYLAQRTYDLKDAITVNGYTAKYLHELYPELNPSGIYTTLQGLRDNPEKTKDFMNKGMPNKDAFPSAAYAKGNDDKQMS